MIRLRKMLKRVGDRGHLYSGCCSEPFSHAAIHLDCTCRLIVEQLNGVNEICSHILLPHGGP